MTQFETGISMRQVFNILMATSNSKEIVQVLAKYRHEYKTLQTNSAIAGSISVNGVLNYLKEKLERETRKSS